MFTKLTQQEEDKLRLAQAIEDAKEETKPSEPIEVSAERWRANAFFTQEALSDNFETPELVPEGQAVYRISERNGWAFLESRRLSKDGTAYGWTGVMFRKEDGPELLSCLKDWMEGTL